MASFSSEVGKFPVAWCIIGIASGQGDIIE
jgi:hypothetical protein